MDKAHLDCITYVEYHILTKGKELGLIIPQRGLRQGDPLSPYLFILVLEGLGVMIRKQERKGVIHGVIITRGAPTITHIFLLMTASFFERLML